MKTYNQLSEEYLKARDEVTNIKSMKSDVNSSIRRLTEELYDLTARKISAEGVNGSIHRFAGEFHTLIIREVYATVKAKVSLEALMSHKEQ